MRKIFLIFGLVLLCGIGNVCGQDVSAKEKEDNKYLLIVTDYSHEVKVDDGICSAYTLIRMKKVMMSI